MRSDLRDFLSRSMPQLCQAGDNFAEIRRFIAGAGMRMRCLPRGIRLYQQRFRGEYGRRRPQTLGARVGECAAQPQQKSHIYQSLCLYEATGEAV